MPTLKLDELMVRTKLKTIIKNITNIEISHDEYSLFASEYALSAEMMVYILMSVSEEFNLELNEQFVESLSEYSFNDLVNSIITGMTEEINEKH